MAAKKKTSKASKKSRGPSKTAFVLGLPADMSARDAVAKAKDSGLVISEAYVYKIRSSAKGGSSKKPKGPRAAKAAKAPKATRATKAARPPKASAGTAATGGAPSKTEFVRSLPPGTSYDDAAAKAKALGIELSKAYFYVLKSELKKKAGGAGMSAPRGKPGPKPRATSMAATRGLRLTSDNAAEQALLDAVRSLGASRARDLISAIENFERG
jgi:hypothetical protein